MFKHGFPPEWSTLKKLIWLVGSGIAGAASGIWKTVTGTLLHITDALPSPVKELSVAIEPYQDLTYGDPYPAGGSKNLIPDGTDTSNGYVANSYLKVDGTTGTASDFYVSEYFSVTSDATYTWSEVGSKWANLASICFYDSGKNFISGIAGEKSLPKTFAVPSNAVYCRASQSKNFRLNGFQIELGSTATTIKPYSNICQITGWTECNLYQASTINRFTTDGATTGKYLRTDDRSVSSSAWNYSDYIPVLPNRQYTFNPNSDTGGSAYSLFYDSTKTEISYIDSGKQTFTTPSNCYYMRFSYRAVSTNIQLEMNGTGSDYEVYSVPTTYPISFPDSAGTVYGGTLDVVNGTLTVTDAEIASYNGETLPSTWISDRDVYAVGTTPTIGAQVVYKLATPTEIQLTPQEITTLVGENNIWADVNGDITLTYQAVPQTAFSDNADTGMADYMTLTE